MMKINKHFVNRIFGALLCLFIFTCASVDSIAVPAPTKFDVVPDWPKQLPNNWIMGQVAGVDVDSKDNIWIAGAGNTDDVVLKLSNKGELLLSLIHI